MAKRRGPNVSAAIKEYLAKNPSTGPTEAAKAISEAIGKKVPSTYVSNIKTTMSKSKKKRGRKPGKKMAHSMNGSIDLATLEAMKQIVSRVGADTAKRLIDVLG